MRINPSSALLPELQRGKPVSITVNGSPMDAYMGETIASVLLAAGIRTFRLSEKTGEPRGIFCGIGLCYECLVTVDGVHAVRACVTPVVNGMQIDTGKGLDL